MLHKRVFGKRGVVAVLMHGDDMANRELLGRVDAAAHQFGITNDYAFDFFCVKHCMQSVYGYREMTDRAAEIAQRRYKVVMTVGPEAAIIMKQVLTQFHQSLMTIGINTQAALDAQAPEQYEMVNMDPLFEGNVSNLVRLCLDSNVSQEEGVAQIRKYEAARLQREWGIFDDCYVIIKSKSGKQCVVRFEDKDDVMLPSPTEITLMGRGRIILFQA
jgi:hypothetical protein